MTIQAFHAQNYGCLRDVHVTLGTRLHAFVGPNDSGKSTLLRGIRSVLQFAGDLFRRGDNGHWEPFDPFPWRRSESSRGTEESSIGCDAERGSFTIAIDPDAGLHQRLELNDPPQEWGSPRSYTQGTYESPVHTIAFDPVLDRLTGVRLCQFDPSALRSPSGLIPRGDLLGFFDDRGLGLPGIYQAILGRGDDSFSQIRAAVQKLFPTVKRIAVVPITRSEVTLEIELMDGTVARASELSAGLLHYLAFAAIPHLDPVSALLIEEPENGLHPARIKEVIRLLREFAERTDTQVFMATHSPLVLNELSADEISVVTRPSLERGSVVTPLRATPHFERRSKVYSAGELWLAYCDGEQEAPLLDENTK